MREATLNELNKKFGNCPVRTSRYFVGGNEYIVHSHFCGNKDIDQVISTIAFNRAMSDIFAKTKKLLNLSL